jgi:hypothetical protein
MPRVQIDWRNQLCACTGYLQLHPTAAPTTSMLRYEEREVRLSDSDVAGLLRRLYGGPGPVAHQPSVRLQTSRMPIQVGFPSKSRPEGGEWLRSDRLDVPALRTDLRW